MAYLNINSIIPVSEVNGPGKRFVIWFQGCNHDCTGCFNKPLQEMKNNQIISVDEMMDKISSTVDIEGVTFSGGEPFLQVDALLELSEKIKKQLLTIVSYTGFTLNELKNDQNPKFKEILNLMDILIDGKYSKDNRSNCIWIGSSNQRINFLSDRYSDYIEEIVGQSKEIEYFIDKSGDIILTGFPDFNPFL
jgi:anaerobic ribonucleoside-triphosphate reductase activating protein